MFWDYYLAPVAATVTFMFLAYDLGVIRFRHWWWIAIDTLLSACVIAINLWALHTYGDIVLFKSYPLTIFFPLAAIAALFGQYRDARTLYGLCTVTALTFVMVFIPIVISLYFDYLHIVFQAMSIIIAVGLMLFTHLFLRKIYLEVLGELSSGWVVYTILPVLGCICLMADLFLYQVIDTIVLIILGLLIIILEFVLLGVFFYFFRQLQEKYVLERDVESLRMQTRAQEKVSAARREAEAKEKRLRHDQRHAVQVIIDELENGHVDGALKYLVQLRGDDLVPIMAYCHEPSVNSVFRLWALRAQDAGIDMSIRADIPEGLEVDAMELSMLFANLIENAYEGCLRVEKSETKRFISVSCRHDDGKLTCKIENSCRPDIRFVEGMPQSQKRGGGIGTHSAKTTVEQHAGIIRYSLDDGVFSVRFVMAV